MKKNFIKPLLPSLLACLAFVSCDSGPDDTDEDLITLDLSARGLDLDDMQNNPTDTVKLPVYLLAQDKIVHGNIPAIDGRELTQLDDGYINSSGELKVDNITLSWKRVVNDNITARFSLSPINDVFPTLDEDKVDFYTTEMDKIIAAAEGSTASLNNALVTDYNSSTAGIVADAGSSIGMITSVGPETTLDGFDFAMVLMERYIIYTSETTNQEFLNTGIITGSYTFTDRWGYSRLISDEDEGSEAVFDQLDLSHNDTPFLLHDVIDSDSGTFTIQINN